jgi:eukaryotic-like serine/threonine-protein kinase
MGEVWAATHQVTRRSVAMKFVKSSSHMRPELRRRFMREARAASAVQHPNVVEVFDVFELDAETPVMVMELLSGETLGVRLARESQLGLDQTLALLLPAVSAVGTAHALGIVHRDLKPDNLFLARSTGSIDSETIVKVLDFGIAKLSSELTGETGVTETGTTLGTPCYMAPEQAMAERELDQRGDVWAFGVILYETLSGARPIEGDTVGQVVKHLMTTGITPLEHVVPGLPAPLTALVARMLSRERSRRPEDLREVFEVLRGLTGVRARSFGPPGSEAPAAETLEESRSDGDALVRDEARTRVDPVASTVQVDTAGPHAVSSMVKRRSQSGWLLAGAAASALVGGALVYALTRPAPQAPASSLASALTSSSESIPALPASVPGAISSVERMSTASALAAPVDQDAAAIKKTAAPAKTRETRPASAAVKSIPAATASAPRPEPAAASAPSAAPAKKPSIGGLAEKPPF